MTRSLPSLPISLFPIPLFLFTLHPHPILPSSPTAQWLLYPLLQSLPRPLLDREARPLWFVNPTLPFHDTLADHTHHSHRQSVELTYRTSSQPPLVSLPRPCEMSSTEWLATARNKTPRRERSVRTVPLFQPFHIYSRVEEHN